jgi:D-glycero-alpha-D-manno-heptose 1-phosphate guanylyltransferase
MKEAIILAGGFGSRLQGVVPDIPKPMAPVSGQPFIKILLQQLAFWGFSKVVLSVGYKYECIKNYFGDTFGTMRLDYCIEDVPLGTGGAVARSLQQTGSDDVLVVNGDSILLASLDDFLHFHRQQHSPASMALKAEKHFGRYGAVVLDGGRIVRFDEKQYVEEGVFNAGLYWLGASVRNYLCTLPAPFSLEKDVFEQQIFPLYGCVFHDYFIDIGIPEDYARAQTELPIVWEQYAAKYTPE